MITQSALVVSIGEISSLSFQVLRLLTARIVLATKYKKRDTRKIIPAGIHSQDLTSLTSFRKIKLATITYKSYSSHELFLTSICLREEIQRKRTIIFHVVLTII